MSASAFHELSSFQQNANGLVYLGFEGTVVAGSYDAVNGTVEVVVGETLADFGDDSPGMSIVETFSQRRSAIRLGRKAANGRS